MLLEATQFHELLASTFYGVELKQDKILFPITPFGYELEWVSWPTTYL
jgi:hypothetical protein